MKIKENKGITLIALVITIIVLLILAGVTINMVLGDNGIISQAQSAKQTNEEKSKEDAVARAYAEWQIKNKTNTFEEGESTDEEEYVKDRLVEDGIYTQTELEGMDLTSQGKLVLATPPVPTGFTASIYEGETTIAGGFVIYETDSLNGINQETAQTTYNQFVWVPVDNSTLPMFNRDGENYTGKLYNWKDWNGTGNLAEMDVNYYKEPRVSPNNGTSTDNIQEEYNLMAKSVETYGGFYVGRYETSWNSTASKVASVANVTAMNGETQINGETGANWYTFYDKQKELSTRSVTSGMIYGSQWDAIMKWMKDVENIEDSSKLYIKDSTGMGHFCFTYEICSVCNGSGRNTYYLEMGDYLEMGEEDCWTCNGYGIREEVPLTETEGPILTGSNDNYKVKNIYDLAGNYCEWTQEAFDTLSRVNRGDNYYSVVGGGSPASSRFNCISTQAYGCWSSRLQLYIK